MGILTALAIGLLTGCGSDSSKVQDSVLPQYSNNFTVGQAFNAWSETQGCSSLEWEDFTTKQGAKVVQVTCEMDVSEYQTPEVMAVDVTEEALAKAEQEYSSHFNKLTQLDEDQKNVQNWGKLEDIQVEFRATRNMLDIADAKVTKIREAIAFKSLQEMRIRFQFTISADGETFTPTYERYEVVFSDDKKTKLRESLGKVYSNTQITLNTSFALLAYKNRE